MRSTPVRRTEPAHLERRGTRLLYDLPARPVRPRPARLRRLAVVAIDQPALRRVAVLGLRCFQIDAILVGQRADLFDALARPCGGVILGTSFDGLPSDRLLAMIRTTGCDVPAVVVDRDPWLGGDRWLRGWVDAILSG